MVAMVVKHITFVDRVDVVVLVLTKKSLGFLTTSSAYLNDYVKACLLCNYVRREVSATSGPRFNTERKRIISSPAAAGEFDATDGGARRSRTTVSKGV
jgi:hypothetical protein